MMILFFSAESEHFTTINNRQFGLYIKAFNYTESRAICQSRGMDLATFKDNMEFQQVGHLYVISNNKKSFRQTLGVGNQVKAPNLRQGNPDNVLIQRKS